MAAGKQTKPKATVVELPARRERYHRLLPDPRVDTRSRWAKSRPELQHLTEAQMVVELMATDAFQETVQPLLDQVEAERSERQRRKRTFLYSVTEVEKAMIFKAITGINLMTELREKLTADEPGLRETLGFDWPRNPDREMVRMDGVPSLATLCRHRQLFDRRERAEAYARFFERVRDDHFVEFPVEMLDEIRQLGIDGSKIEIQGECPIYDKKDKGKQDKKPVNPKRITCPDGGYVGRGASPDKSGHGFNKHTIATATKLPLVFEVTPLNDAEIRTGEKLIDQLDAEILSQYPERALGVMNGDSAYSGPDFRKRARRFRMIENIHKTSHADKPEVVARVESLREERIKIKGHPSWFSDGLYQLVCKCKRGNVRPGYSIDKNGRTLTWVEGSCKHGCGSITITSGWWRIAQNPRQWVRINPANKKERPDLAFGNPLTYDHPVSNTYGRQRRSRQEGLNSVMATRMNLTTGKRRYKTIQDARADVAVSYALAHFLTMIQRRAAAGSCAPPLAA